MAGFEVSKGFLTLPHKESNVLLSDKGGVSDKDAIFYLFCIKFCLLLLVNILTLFVLSVSPLLQLFFSLLCLDFALNPNSF